MPELSPPQEGLLVHPSDMDEEDEEDEGPPPLQDCSDSESDEEDDDLPPHGIIVCPKVMLRTDQMILPSQPAASRSQSSSPDILPRQSINGPTFEALQDSTNTTLATKEKKASSFGRVFKKFIEITQYPDFDYTKTSKTELNVLLIGFFSGCSAYAAGGEPWSGPKYWLKVNGESVLKEYQPNTMRNNRINLSNLFTKEHSAYSGDNPCKLEHEPEFNGERSCIQAMNMYIARNRLNPELAKENYGETPRAAVGWSLDHEAQIRAAVDLSKPMERVQLTVSAFASAFGFRGGESLTATVAAFTMHDAIGDRDSAGFVPRFVAYHPQWIKNLRQSAASGCNTARMDTRKCFETDLARVS